MQPDDGDGRRRSRARPRAGIRTALVSNSWGVHRYPHDLFDELFDGVVISGEEGIAQAVAAHVRARRRARRAWRADACVFVDDLPFNLTPAEELGMATVHHTERRARRSRELESAAAAIAAGAATPSRAAPRSAPVV